jgi:hypothetical protein
MRASPLVLALSGVVLAASAAAAPLTPSSYDMPNGNGQASGGSFNYWDREYTGAGCTTCDGALLSGGLGNLTDGVTTNLNWFSVENGAGTGPYVGWLTDPTITFRFAQTVLIDSVTLHLDDSDGAGGVSPPAAVILSDGVIQRTFTVGPQPGSAPFFVSFSGQALQTDVLMLTLVRATQWVFMDEVSFDGRQVGQAPEPSGAALLGLGLLAMGLGRRRAR